MKIKIVQNPDCDAWFSNLNDYSYSLFISPLWIEALKDETMQPLYLDFFSNDELVAKIGGFAVNSRISLRRKLFFYAGPAIRLTLPEKTIEYCIKELINYTKINRYVRLVVLSYDYPHKSEFHCKGYGICKRSEFIVDLLLDKENINKNISRGAKRSIAKAIDQGFSFKESDSQELSEKLIQLIKETKNIRLSKGYSDYNSFYFPYFTSKAFENLIKENAVRFYYIEKDGEIYAVQAILQHNQKAYAMFIGVKTEGYKYGVPAFIDCSVIYSLKNDQYLYLNFGGVPTDKTHKGIALFKESLGAVEYFSSYGSTNFLIFPHLLLNPIVNIIRKFPENLFINYVKRLVNI